MYLYFKTKCFFVYTVWWPSQGRQTSCTRWESRHLIIGQTPHQEPYALTHTHDTHNTPGCLFYGNWIDFPIHGLLMRSTLNKNTDKNIMNDSSPGHMLDYDPNEYHLIKTFHTNVLIYKCFPNKTAALTHKCASNKTAAHVLCTHPVAADWRDIII